MLLLVLRVLTSPITNVFQKRLTNKGANSIFIVLVTYLFFGAILLPFLFLINYSQLTREFWFSVAAASLLDGIGNIFLVKSLKTTELSVFGPLNSFKPALAMIVSVVMLNEVPDIKGIIGLLIIVAGSILITYEKPFRITVSGGMIFRITGIFFSVLGAIFTKKAINLSSPEITIIFWTLLAIPVMVSILTADRKNALSDFSLLRINMKDYLILGITYSLMQYLTMLCFKYTYVGYSLAIFQLSTIISVFLGYKYFSEPGMKKKLVSSLIMICGAILILID